MIDNQTNNTAIKKFKQHKLALISSIILIVLILIVSLLPLLIPLDPYTADPLAFSAPPSKTHIIGTDAVGRDVFSRLIYGGRTSILVGVVSTLIASFIGVPLGMIAGYYQGALSTMIMRLCDIFMSVPSMVLILVLVAIIGPSLWSVTLVIGLLGWPQFARLSFAGTLSASKTDYVESAVAVGTHDINILKTHILPNIFAPLLTAASFMTANAIITESGLSFLGMGVQIPESSWGNMLFDAQSISVLAYKPWQWLPPGISLVILVMSINFVGDGIRSAISPKLRK